MTPITQKDLGINEVTQLQEILKVWEVNISSETETIEVKYEVVTLSPTNVEISTTGRLSYYRRNTEENKAFDFFKNSPIGQGIIQAINGTLNNYPNLG